MTTQITPLAIVTELCEAERDRLTMTELGIDEALTILERHGLNSRDDDFADLARISRDLHHALTIADGPERRLQRLTRLRNMMTGMLPLTDADLAKSP